MFFPYSFPFHTDIHRYVPHTDGQWERSQKGESTGGLILASSHLYRPRLLTETYLDQSGFAESSTASLPGQPPSPDQYLFFSFRATPSDHLGLGSALFVQRGRARTVYLHNKREFGHIYICASAKGVLCCCFSSIFTICRHAKRIVRYRQQ
jgi:hypothetical protein